MRTRQRIAQVLGLAAMSGLGLQYAKQGAGGAAPNPPPADTAAGGEGDQAPEKIELTQEEYDRRLKEATDKAIKDALEKREAEEKKARNRRRGKDEEEDEEDLVEAATKAEVRAAEAEQRAAAAERKALMGEVGVKLRDYLTLNFKEYLGNAPDIMLHVEKALPTDAAEALIARVIDAQAKAFVERSKASRGGGGAPGGGMRGRMAGQPNQTTNEQKPGERQTAPATPRFRSLNYHG